MLGQGSSLDLGPTYLPTTVSSKKERTLEQLQPSSSKDLEVEYLNCLVEMIIILNTNKEKIKKLRRAHFDQILVFGRKKPVSLY